MPAEGTFLGYPRRSGRAGVRNHTLVLSINGLIGSAARRVASAIHDGKLVATPYGRSQIGPDKEAHFRLLTGIGANPNVGAVLVLGADRKFADQVASRIGELSDQPLEVLTLDDVHEDAFDLTAKATRIGARLAREVSRSRRGAVPVSELYLGLECGHSDATSGLISNPLAGAIVDRLVDAGGTAVVGETIEWLGAEEVLRSRATDAQVGAAIVEAVRTREEAVTALGEDLLGNNPGQENIRGGISTMEEKSLGAISKTGSRPIRSFLGFAESPTINGLHVMDGPSFSPESMTGFVASGTQVGLFTTGPGNSFCGLIAPTVKITANPEAARRLLGQIDFDASLVFRAEETPDQAADRLFAEILDIASGSLTWGEITREGAESFTRLGPSL
jgi:altronate dehydratase large subunit